MPRSLRIVALAFTVTLVTAVPTVAAGAERTPNLGASPSLAILDWLGLDQLLERVGGVIAKIGPNVMPSGEATSGEDEESSPGTDAGEGAAPPLPPSN